MEIPENRRIQDLESWLQVNALPTNDSTTDNLNQTQQQQVEEQSIWDQQQEYQKHIHESIFQEYDANEQQQKLENEIFLNTQFNENDMIQIITTSNSNSNNSKEDVQNDDIDCDDNDNNKNNNIATTTETTTTTTIIKVPVRKLCETCDVIFTYVQSLQMYNNNDSNNNFATTTTSTSTDIVIDDNNSTESERKLNTMPKQLLQFSLIDYTTESVQEFLNIILYETKTIYDYTNKEYILVDICRIAHYLQCNTTIIECITKNIFLISLDTSNCLFFVQLADELNISLLFEQSIQLLLHSITKIENIENVNNDTTRAEYTSCSVNTDTGTDTDTDMSTGILTNNDNKNNKYTKVVLTSNNNKNNDNNDTGNNTIVVSSELYERIIQIKTAIQSSIHNQRSEIYVSTIQEYIAIFAEQVQYYTERLHDAIDNFKLIQAKQQNNDNGTNNDHYYNDIQTKIYNQQQRVQTLQIALQEQKKLFLNSHNKFVV